MEMQEIPEDVKRQGEEEAKAEEAETEHYSSLHSRTEDVYAEAKFLPDASKANTGGRGGVRLWRRVALSLGGICLILILVIILLLVLKRPSDALCTSPAALHKKPAAADCQKRLQADLCAHGWLHHGESCFYMSTLRRTWDQAQRNCSELGGGLAVISSPSLQNFLTQSGRRQYWIGLRLDGSWTWINNQRLTQSYWSDTESGGNCVLLIGNVSSDKSWFRSSCTRLTYYICELPVPRN